MQSVLPNKTWTVPLEEWPEMDRSMVEVVRFVYIPVYSQKTSVRHESPQVLVIANGEVIFHASQRGEQGEYYGLIKKL